MNNPAIRKTIGGYTIVWEDFALSAIIKRLVTHSDGRVTGDLQINNCDKKSPMILLPSTQFNFSSEPTRRKMAKDLKEKYPDSECEWAEVFDYLGHEIQTLARSGEPAEEIWAQDEATAPEPLVKPIIYKGQSNIIYGEKGVLKSTLAYFVGACLFLPWSDNPLELQVGTNSVKSLVLDWETDRKTFEYYLSRMKRGMNMPAFSLYYRQCRLPLSEEIEAVEQYVNETGAELLIIDSLAAAAGGEQGELKGSQSALQFNAALRKLGKTSLIIAQTSKDITSHKKTVYGSVMFTYYARNILELCRADEEDSDTLHLGLFHRECNFARRSPPIGIQITFDDANKTLSMKRESISIQEFIEKVSHASKILDSLKSGAKDTTELAEIIGMKPDVARTVANRLKNRGQIIKVGEKWGLVSREKDG